MIELMDRCIFGGNVRLGLGHIIRYNISVRVRVVVNSAEHLRKSHKPPYEIAEVAIHKGDETIARRLEVTPREIVKDAIDRKPGTLPGPDPGHDDFNGVGREFLVDCRNEI